VEVRFRSADGGRGRDSMIRVGEAVPGRDDFQAFRYEFNDVTASMTLDVIGGGDDLDALRAQAERLGVTSRVRWLGHVDRSALPEAYRSAQAIMMPSRDEGLGLVGVEAQLCGTPVIAYRSGGLPDVVDPAWGGRLVEPGDIAGLAAAMRDVLTPDAANTRAGLAQQARARMLDRFAPAAVAGRYLRIYERAMRRADT